LILCYAKLLSIIFQSTQRKEERCGCGYEAFIQSICPKNDFSRHYSFFLTKAPKRAIWVLS